MWLQLQIPLILFKVVKAVLKGLMGNLGHEVLTEKVWELLYISLLAVPKTSFPDVTLSKSHLASRE